jgi:hypothetical protein
MALNFGLANIKAYRNGIYDGCSLSTGVVGTGITCSSGRVYIDGMFATISSASITLGAGSSGTGGWVVGVIPAGNSSTAAFTAVMQNPTELYGTKYALLDRYSFGTAANNTTMLTAATSEKTGCTAYVAIGRAMNVSINITYDQAIARGGTLVFGDDMKYYNGAIEGNAEYAEIDVQGWSRLFGGSYASAGNASGTWTLSATQQPINFVLETNVLTDGVTGRFSLLKCYSNQLSIKFDRENYLIPNFNFVAVANFEGNIATITE